MDYKKILEGIVNIINTTEKSDIGFVNICTYIGENCPELKESEDEKIRKALIDYFNDFTLPTFEGLEPKKILAWLEKQGEHKRFRDFIQVGDKVTRNESGELVNISQLERIAKPRRAKPTDKIKPKFKIGDWITDGEAVFYVTSYDIDYGYQLETQKGTLFHFSDEKVENKYHLWTIEDAKSGDVLVCPKYAGDIIPNIFIFKDIKIKDNDVFCYCSFIEAFRTESYIANADPINTDFYPATKEQRDTLMRAMSDAGYTFDFEKKELIEESKNIKNQIMSEITDLVKDCITPKPAEWSEEDEDMLYKTISVINRLCAEGKEYVWSINTLKKLFYWLKSLKNKYTWKPSDEQMKFLWKYAEQNNCDGSILTSLYNDLKKLKEE